MILVLASTGAAASLTFGVVPFLATDLSDATFAAPTAQFPVGGGVTLPLRIALRPGATVRVALALAAAPGTDTVTWSEGGATWADQEHWAMVGQAALSLGGEFAVLPSAPVTPYLGAGAGGGAVANFHSFGGDTALLLDPTQNELDNPDNIDPYTLVAAPLAEAWVGVRIGQNVALDVEAGYTVTFVSAAPLRKSPSELGARRSAYALDLLRMGVGVSVPL